MDPLPPPLLMVISRCRHIIVTCCIFLFIYHFEFPTHFLAFEIFIFFKLTNYIVWWQNIVTKVRILWQIKCSNQFNVNQVFIHSFSESPLWVLSIIYLTVCTRLHPHPGHPQTDHRLAPTKRHTNSNPCTTWKTSWVVASAIGKRFSHIYTCILAYLCAYACINPSAHPPLLPKAVSREVS